MTKKRVDYADEFAALLERHAPDIPEPAREFRFHPVRRWRFDFAWEDERLALEVNGGRWLSGGGRHSSDRDYEKINAAAVLGWRVMFVSKTMMDNDPWSIFDDIRSALDILWRM